jgi:hypothetical protein
MRSSTCGTPGSIRNAVRWTNSPLSPRGVSRCSRRQVAAFVGPVGHDGVPGLLEGMDGFVARAPATKAPIEFLNDPAALDAFDNQPTDPSPLL